MDSDKYLNYRSIYKSVLRESETTHYKTIFDRNKNNTKTIWKNINSIFSYSNKSKKSSNNINKLVYKNIESTNASDICSNLNEYFCNVASSIHDTVSKTNTSHMKFMGNSNPKTIFLEAVTNLELSDIIDNLKLNKSPDNDNIGPKIVFDSKKILLEPLSFIYNLSISTGTVPAQTKLAKVIPVYKKGDRCSPGNYHPISMLSAFDKMLEKLLRIG